MEKHINEMSAAELREALREFTQAEAKAQVPEAPVHPDFQNMNLAPDVRANVSDLWVTSIMKKPAGTWTAAEREAVRTACRIAQQ